MARSITYTALPDIPLVEPGDELAAIIQAGLARADITLQDGDVIVLAQKIVSKAENRYVSLKAVTPSARAYELARITGKDPRHLEVVLQESEEVLRAKTNVIIVAHRLGFVMANAGIDESNISQGNEPRVLLLPEDPKRSCEDLKRRLEAHSSVRVGVVMNDSFGRAWRNGVVGVAIGAAGIASLHSLIGQPDLFGRPMMVTEIAVADELAAAASLLMGQGQEGTPVIHVRGFINPSDPSDVSNLIRAKAMDMFR